jgi:hypothetical protein
MKKPKKKRWFIPATWITAKTAVVEVRADDLQQAIQKVGAGMPPRKADTGNVVIINQKLLRSLNK